MPPWCGSGRQAAEDAAAGAGPDSTGIAAGLRNRANRALGRSHKTAEIPRLGCSRPSVAGNGSVGRDGGCTQPAPTGQPCPQASRPRARAAAVRERLTSSLIDRQTPIAIAII